MTEQQSSAFEIVRCWGNRVFVVVVLIAILGSLYNNWDAIQSFNWRIQPIGVLLAIFAYMSFFLIRGAAWVWTLNWLDVEISFPTGLRVYLYTYASRYIPGAIWPLVTLNVISHNLGQSKRIFTFAFLLNIVLLAFVDVLYFTPFIYELIGISGLIAYSISIYAIPNLLRFGFVKFSQFNFVPESTNWMQFTQSHIIFRLFSLTIVHQVFQLFSYFIFISSVMVLDTPQITYITIAYAISWLIGFLIIFVPQGLGVREVSFIFLTAPIITTEVAITLSVALRLLTIISELIAFLCILGYDKFYTKNSKNS